MQGYDLKELHKGKQFEELAKIWDEYRSGEGGALNEWDYLYFMNGLYKCRRYNDCLAVYKECQKNCPGSELLNDKMGWSVYQVHLKNHDFENGDNEHYRKMVDYVLERCSDGDYSPLRLIVKQATDAVFKSKLSVKPDYELAERYLSKITPESCSDEERVFKDKSGEERHTMSERESWFAKMSKVQLELKRYPECLETCRKALGAGLRFHNNMDGWFYYRMAQAHKEMGKEAEAMECLRHSLSLGMKNWVLYALGRELASAAGDAGGAKCFAAKAALCDGSHEKRVKFYDDLAELLYRAGETRPAMLHRRLAYCLREENGWKLKEESSWQLDDEVAAMDKKKLLAELKPLWEKWLESGQERLQGKVNKLLANGKGGFVRTDKGDSYYFRVNDVRSGREALAEGSQVDFVLEERFDKSKQEMKQNAVALRVLSGK